MQIELNNLSKRFNREWIFKNLTHTFEANSRTAIIGSNGSGKSTLLKILSAAELPTEGELKYTSNQNNLLDHSDVYQQLSFSAPYMDLPEQLNPSELFQFQLKFRPFQNNLKEAEFLELVFLEDSKHKQLKYFSSGMKQRLKLGLAICAQSAVLILDEPCSNLDQKGMQLYQNLLHNYGKSRTIIIGSNEQKEEIFNITNFVNVLDYK